MDCIPRVRSALMNVPGTVEVTFQQSGIVTVLSSSSTALLISSLDRIGFMAFDSSQFDESPSGRNCLHQIYPKAYSILY